jgi:parallel beta-helix repeat protein
MHKYKKKNPRTRNRELARFEQLEARQLYSVVTVTPANFQAAINSSNVGDTINFTPGNYVLPTNPSGPAAVWPTGRQYVGNGAVLSLSGGIGGSNCVEETVKLTGSATTTEFTGFVVNDAQIDCESGSFNVHNNTFQNGVVGVFVANNNNSNFNNNTFTQLSGGGIYGYPGSNNTYDNNSFDYVFEPIHLASSCNNTDVSGNVMTHITRNGIELQDAMTNLTVENNYMADWLQYGTGNIDSHMGISCATMYGSNITISGNTLLQNGPEQNMDVGVGWKSAIEIMANSGVTISNNYVWGWSHMILNGIGPEGFTSSNNVAVGGNLVGGDDVGDAYQIGTDNATNDQLYALNAANAPAWPTMPTTAGSSTTVSASAPVTTTASAPTVSAPTVSAATGLTATSPSSSEVDLSWTDNTNGTGSYILQRRATNGSTGFQTIATLPAGTTSYQDTNVNAQWEYDYELTAVVNGVSSADAAVHTQVQAAPAPVVVAPVVTAAATNLAATSPSSSQVNLSWTDNTNGTATYLLQRRATYGSTGFQTIATLAAGTTSYQDTNVNAQWQYDYQLTAVVNGVSSAIAAVHTQVQAAPVPVVIAPVVTTPVVTTPVVTTPVVTTPVVTTPVVTTPVVTTPVVTAPVVTAPVATTVTAAPSSVAVTNAGPGQITVTWAAGQGVPTIYIYPTMGAGGAAAAIDLGQLAAGATSATIGGINNTWQVIAQVSFTVNGVESSKTDAPDIQVNNSTVSPTAVFTPSLQAPVLAQPTTSTGSVAVSSVALPTNFTATSPNSGEVDLSWTDNTNGSASYILERRAANGPTGYRPIATIAAGVSTYRDVHVTANWEYNYLLIAINSGVTSTAVSTHVQVQNVTGGTALASSTAPAAPTVLLAASPNSSEVDLSWVDNSGGTAAYVLERRATYGAGAFQIIATLPAGSTSFTDTNVTPQWEYDYSLVAVTPGAASDVATVEVQVQAMLSLPLSLANAA